ncbi:hypothetical protein Cgig2_004007 [Carnegiea gigantea]|uniref:Uncharacterized protein n=1 Tax=Carnegiea gigantea TaxID=171969 RepID=A0A9Q1KBN6_9CARY|nr:hypothetical protein Cgig2_004007 [Carnegiea gigantea]
MKVKEKLHLTPKAEHKAQNKGISIGHVNKACSHDDANHLGDKPHNSHSKEGGIGKRHEKLRHDNLSLINNGRSNRRAIWNCQSKPEWAISNGSPNEIRHVSHDENSQQDGNDVLLVDGLTLGGLASNPGHDLWDAQNDRRCQNNDRNQIIQSVNAVVLSLLNGLKGDNDVDAKKVADNNGGKGSATDLGAKKLHVLKDAVDDRERSDNDGRDDATDGGQLAKLMIHIVSDA